MAETLEERTLLSALVLDDATRTSTATTAGYNITNSMLDADGNNVSDYDNLVIESSIISGTGTGIRINLTNLTGLNHITIDGVQITGGAPSATTGFHGIDIDLTNVPLQSLTIDQATITTTSGATAATTANGVDINLQNVAPADGLALTVQNSRIVSTNALANANGVLVTLASTTAATHLNALTLADSTIEGISVVASASGSLQTLIDQASLRNSRVETNAGAARSVSYSLTRTTVGDLRVEDNAHLRNLAITATNSPLQTVTIENNTNNTSNGFDLAGITTTTSAIAITATSNSFATSERSDITNLRIAGNTIQGSLANANTANGVVLALTDSNVGSYANSQAGATITGNTIQNLSSSAALRDARGIRVLATASAAFVTDNGNQPLLLDFDGNIPDLGGNATVNNATLTGDDVSGLADVNGIRNNQFTSINGVGLNVVTTANTTFRGDVADNTFVNTAMAGAQGQQSVLLSFTDRPTNAMFDSYNLVFDRNTITTPRGAGFELTMDNNAVGSFDIHDNTVSNNLDTAPVGSVGYVFGSMKVNLLGTNVSNEATNLLRRSFFDNNTISRVGLAGTNTGHGVAFLVQEASEVQDLHIRDNDIRSNGGSGLSFQRDDRAVLRTSNPLEGQTRAITISGNTIGLNNQSGMILDMRNGSLDLLDFEVAENFIGTDSADPLTATDIGNGQSGITLFARADARLLADITNNQIRFNNGDGINLQTVSANTLTDKRQVGGTWTGNTITDNSQNGIRLNGRHGLFDEATAIATPLIIGVEDNDGTTFSNVIANNGGAGLFMNNGGDNGLLVFADNLVRANASNGIFMRARGEQVAFSNNQIETNTGKGIDLETFGAGFFAATIRNNTITGQRDDAVGAAGQGDGIELLHEGNGSGGLMNIVALGNFIDNNAGRGVDVLKRGNGDMQIRFGDGTLEGQNAILSNLREGFYVVSTADPAQLTDVNTVTAGGTPFTNDARHNMTLTVDGNLIQFNGINQNTLGASGLILRVGTSSEFSGGPASGNFAATYRGVQGTNSGDPNVGNGRVNAQITNNQFEGNFGDDFLVRPFISTSDPITTTGTWDATTFDITAMMFDPLARLNMIFEGNTGNGIDVVPDNANEVPGYRNADDFKSRINTATPPGPYGIAPGNTRHRMATRLAISSAVQDLPPVPPDPGATFPFPAGEQTGGPNLSESTFRIQLGFDRSGPGLQFDNSSGGASEDNFFNTAAFASGEGTFYWETTAPGIFTFPNINAPTFLTAGISTAANPSPTPVSQTRITFSEYVTGVDIADFRLLNHSRETTLTTSVTAAATMISVTDASVFPATPFRVQLENEVMLVTAVNLFTNTLTVTRAQDGTSAVAHTGTLANPLDVTLVVPLEDALTLPLAATPDPDPVLTAIGVPNQDPNNPGAFRSFIIDLSNPTATAGNYELRLQSSNTTSDTIRDVLLQFNNLGHTLTPITNSDGVLQDFAASLNFTVDNVQPVGTVGPIAPDPRNSAAGIVDVVFGEPVLASSVDLADFRLTRDDDGAGPLVPVVVGLSSATVTTDPLTVTTIGGLSFATGYRINLNQLTGAPGTYVLELLATDAITPVTDAAGNIVAAGSIDTWVVDTTLPFVIDPILTTPLASPSNTPVSAVVINFSEAVSFNDGLTSGIDLLDLTLTRTDGSGNTVSLFSGSITGASTPGTIRITSAGHGLSNGDVVTILGVLGNTAANGVWVVANATSTTFDLTGSVGVVTAPYTSGGRWIRNIDGALTAANTITTASNASPIVITTAAAHGLVTGDQVTIAGVNGNTAANGFFTVTLINGTQFSLNGTTGSGAFTASPNARWGRTIRVFQNSTSQYELDLSPVSFVAGTYRLTVNALNSGIQDTAGNTFESSFSQEWVLDASGPTADIVDVAPDPRQAPVDYLNVLFSEVVNGVNLQNAAQHFVLAYDDGVSASTGGITGASFTSPIVITSVGHSLKTGDQVTISGVTGNTNANNVFRVTKLSNDTFSLNGSVGNAAYTGGGTWSRAARGGTLTNATNAPTIVITSLSHGLSNFDLITVYGGQGNLSANGVFQVRNVTANTFELFEPDNSGVPVSGSGIYTSGGRWARNLKLGDAITFATNAGPIVITSNNHGLNDGDTVQVADVTVNTAANGVFVVQNVTVNAFELVGSNGNGIYGGGGTWVRTTAAGESILRQETGIRYVLNLGAITTTNGQYILSLLSNSGITDDGGSGMGPGTDSSGVPQYFNVAAQDDWTYGPDASPVGTIAQVLPNPIGTNAGLVEISFTEPIAKTAGGVVSLNSADFTLTRNGVNVPLNGSLINQTGPTTYTLDLTTATDADGTYVLRLLNTDAVTPLRDLNGNLLADDMDGSTPAGVAHQITWVKASADPRVTTITGVFTDAAYDIDPATGAARATKLRAVGNLTINFSTNVVGVNLTDASQNFLLTRQALSDPTAPFLPVSLEDVPVMRVTGSQYRINLSTLSGTDGNYVFTVLDNDLITDTTMSPTALQSPKSVTWTKNGTISVNQTADARDLTTLGNEVIDANTGSAGFQIALRSAIQEANALTGEDVIELGVGTYTLTLGGTAEDFAVSGDLDVREALTIRGKGIGQTIIDASGLPAAQRDRIFQVLAGVSLTLEGVTLQGGRVTGSEDGGAIRNAGTLIVRDSEIRNNSTLDDSGAINNAGIATIERTTISGNTAVTAGGAIRNVGTLTISNSTLSDNTSTNNGGAISNSTTGTLNLTGVTISGNRSTNALGGGLRIDGGAVTLRNNTIASNVARTGGGGISRGGGVVSVGNTIIADNRLSTSGTPANDIANSAGTFTSAGGNILETNLAGAGFVNGVNNDQVGTDPALLPLAKNGGPTQTHALTRTATVTSIAIDAGRNINVLASVTLDQRLGPRILAGPVTPAVATVDVGAFEFGTFFVNTAEDTPDVNLTDGVAADGLGRTSLRAAVMQANALPGENAIMLDGQTYLLTHIVSDTTPPTVTSILGVPSVPTTGAVGVVTINFSEPVGGVDVSDLTLTRGGAPVSLAALTVTQVSSTQYTINLSTVTTTNGLYVLTVNPSTGATPIIDAEGNNLAAAGRVTWVRGADTFAPTATFDPVTTPRLTNIGTVRVVFNEAVNNVTLDHFTLTRGGTPVTLTGSPLSVAADPNFNGRTVATLDLSAVTDTDGAYILTLNPTFGALTIRDPANNALTAPAPLNWTKQANNDILDVTPDPRLDPVTSVTLQFSEPVANVQLTDFTMTYDDGLGGGPQTVDLSNAVLEAVSPVPAANGDAGRQWTLTFDNNESARDGTYVLSFTGAALETVAGGVFAPVTTTVTDTWVIGENNSVIGDLDVSAATGRLQIFGVGADASANSLGVAVNPSIIDAQGNDRIFDVLAGAVMSITGVEVTGGNVVLERSGGAIRNLGDLTIRNGDVSSSFADGNGGGISNGDINTAATLTLFSTDFDSNSAGSAASGSQFGKGGAVYNGNGVVTIDDGSFLSNMATTDGGAIYNDFSATVSITAGTLSGNSADRDGGAIYNNNDAVLTVVSTIMASNDADADNDGDGEGGAIFNENAATLNLNNSLLQNNTARSGGALYNDDGDLTLNDNIFSGNTATFAPGAPAADGGAIFNSSGGSLTIRGGLFTTNSASDNGGAIQNYGMLAIERSLSLPGGVQFLNNVAGTDTGSGAADDNGFGGAIYNEDSTVVIANATFNQNQSFGDGGALYNQGDGFLSILLSTFDGNTAVSRGGAIYNNDLGQVVINQSSLADNSAAGDGGAIYNDSELLNTTQPAANGNLSVGTNAVSTLITLINATAFPLFGGFVIQIDNESMLVTEVIGNTFRVIRGVNGTAAAAHLANAAVATIVQDNLAMAMISSTLSGNTAVNGGALFNSSISTLNVTNSTLSSNTATISGGGLANYGEATLLNSTLHLNDAPIGAGIANNLSGIPPYGPVTLKNTIVSGGTSASDVYGENFVSQGNNLIEDAGIGGSLVIGALNGVITSTATTLTLVSAGQFPATGAFVVLIGNELIEVTAVAVNTLTVVRGFGGTTAAAHSNNDAVTLVKSQVATQINFAGGITAAMTTITVDSVGAFPAFGPYVIRIENELLQVTSVDVATNTFTVTRGFNGTTAAAHADDTVVLRQVDYASVYDATLAEDLDGVETDVTVDSVAEFPSGAAFVPFVIRIDHELMRVTAVDVGTSTLTVTRAFGSAASATTAAAHTTGARVVATVIDGFQNDITGFNPQLDALKDNGGPTLTHALLFGSPARDSGNNLGVTTGDQRDFTRIFDGDGNGTATVDIGAFESGFIVNSFLDSVDENPGDGVNADANGRSTLRAAIMESNARLGEDTIILGSGTFTLTLAGRDEDGSATGDLDVADALNIIGAGTDKTFIDASELDRAFHVLNGVTLNLTNLTLLNGHATSTERGGAVLNQGTLNLDNVHVIDSTAARGGGIYNDAGASLDVLDSVLAGNLALLEGGAIYNDGILTVNTSEIGITDGGNVANTHGGGVFNSGAMTVSDSSFTDNAAHSRGGGLYNSAAAAGSPNTAALTRSTFSDNFASSRGAAIFNEQILTVSNTTLSGNTSGTNAGVGNILTGQVTITNSTVIDNEAFRGGGLANGGAGSITVRNTIIANNLATAVAGVKAPNVRGAFASSGNNFVGNNADGSGFTNNVANDQVGSATSPFDPVIEGLADNGGNTLTHVPRVGSPVLDAGNNSGGDITDQRGALRPTNDDSDVGAVERQDVRLTINDVESDEGDGGSTIFTFVLTLDEASVEEIRVNFALQGDTAFVGEDFINRTGTVVFAPAMLTQTIQVEVNGDTSIEADEQFFVNLTNAINVTLDDTRGVGTIRTDDSGLRINDANRVETDSGDQVFTFTVSVVGAALESDQTLSYTIEQGTADGTDFDEQLVPQTLTFTVGGATSQTISVTVHSDDVPETNETFLVRLINTSVTPVGFEHGKSSGVGTIFNDDLGFTISNGTVTEANSATVQAPGIAGGMVGVTIILGAGEGARFPATGQLTIQVDAEQMRVNSVAGDTLNVLAAGRGFNGTTAVAHLAGSIITIVAASTEVGNLTATATTITVASNVTFPTAAPFTIQVDSEQMLVTVVSGANFTVTRGVNGTTAATHTAGAAVRLTNVVPLNFNVTLLNRVYVPGIAGVPTLAPVTASVSTASGTATSGQDFVPVTSQTVTFNNGSTVQSVAVSILDDLSYEVPAETFQLSVVGGTINGSADATVVGFSSSGIGTIVDNDPPPDEWLIQTNVGATLIQVFLNGVLFSQTADFTNALTVLGNDNGLGPAQDDKFIVDFVNGNPIPTNGLFVDGLTQVGSDSMEFRNGAFNTVTYTTTGTNSGTVSFDGSAVTYNGLEPLRDTTAANNRVFTIAAAGSPNPNMRFGDAGVNNDGLMIIDSVISSGLPTYESVAFLAPTTSMTINAGGGNNTIQLGAPDTMFLAPLVINGDGGNDSIDATAWSLGLTVFGGSGNDTLISGNAADQLDGGIGNDSLLGGSGIDTLIGGDDNDFIDGGAGDEIISGGAGNDTVQGGDGDDTVLGDDGTDRLLGGNGNDSLDGGFGDDTLLGNLGIDTLEGGAGSDVVESTSTVRQNLFNAQLVLVGIEADLLFNVERGRLIDGTGSTILDASAFTLGDVTLEGNDGNDTLIGSGQFDSLVGGNGLDSLTGGAGNDTLDGGADIDALFGQADDDMLLGGAATDNLDGGTGNDSIQGNGDNDTILGQAGIDSIDGGDGDDSLSGGDDGDSILGNLGNDNIDGGLGNDTIDGGAGTDVATGGDGNDSVGGGLGSDTLNGGLGDDTVNGNEDNDSLNGDVGFDTVFGGAGDDTLISDDGNDQLVGQGGAFDTFTFNGDATLGDNFTITSVGTGIGLARLNLTPFTTIVSQVERFTLNMNGGNDLLTLGDLSSVTDLTQLNINGGTGDDSIDGALSANAALPLFAGMGDGNDSVQGTIANDTISGDVGNDTLLANDGNDLLRGLDGDDSLNGNAGDDSVLGGNHNDSIWGGSGQDTLLGEFGLDTIYGHAGLDSIEGGDGNDLLDGGLNRDTIRGGNDNDQIAGREDHDSLFGDNGNDTIKGGTGNDSMYGGAGLDLMDGEADNDYMQGDADNDFMLGGKGNDKLLGGAGNDVCVGDGDGNGDGDGGAPEGRDTVDGQGGSLDTVLGGSGLGANTRITGESITGSTREINELFNMLTARPTLFDELNF